MVRVDATRPGKIGASTRSPLDIQISAKIPLKICWGSAKIPTGLVVLSYSTAARWHL